MQVDTVEQRVGKSLPISLNIICCTSVQLIEITEKSTLSGMRVSFPTFLKQTRQAYKIEITYKIQQPKVLTQKTVTLGDHLRRRRIEFGLYQKDVAAMIGVTTSSVWNWEHGWPIGKRYVPRIITFLGYNPLPCPDDLLDCLAWYKQANGLSFDELRSEMSRDPE